MPSPDSSAKNIQKAITACMKKSAIKKAVALKEYLQDVRVGEELKKELDEMGIEITIKEESRG